jgi:monovalent cation/proton antiporter MnhG/PhaG subunit
VTLRHLLTVVPLWLGVSLYLFAVLGVLVMRSAHDRLHFSAVATLGALFVAIAIVVQESFSLVGDQAALIAVFLVLVSPLLTHAIARAVRIDERADWALHEDEGVEVEEP